MLPISPEIVLAVWIPLAGLLLALCIGPAEEDEGYQH